MTPRGREEEDVVVVAFNSGTFQEDGCMPTLCVTCTSPAPLFFFDFFFLNMTAAFAMNVSVKFLFSSTSAGFLPSAPSRAPSFASPVSSSLETHGKFQTILSKPSSMHFSTRSRTSLLLLAATAAAYIKLSFNFAASTPCNTKTSSPQTANSSNVAFIASFPYAFSKLAFVSCVVAINFTFFNRFAKLKENVKSPSPTVKIRSPFAYKPTTDCFLFLAFCSSSSSSWW